MRAALSAIACGLVLVCASHAFAQVSVEMNADRGELSLGENVVVRISVQTESVGSPEITLPEFDGFEVVQRSVQRPMQFSFGFGQGAPVVTSSTHYLFVLRPIAAGRFSIPPVRVTAGKQLFTSKPLTLTVRGGPSGTGGQQPQSQQAQPQPQTPPASDTTAQAHPPSADGDAFVFDADAFLRTVVDKTEPYEGEQVTATIYLYTRRNLQQVPSVQAEASTDGFWTHDLLSAARSLEPTRQRVGGRVFWVYVLRRFAAFPLRAGELTLGSMTLTLSRESIFDLFDPARAAPDLKRSGVPITLHVKPLPAAGKPASEVAIGRFELEAELDRAQVATGDAVTLKTTLRGRGNLRAVKLEAPSIPGLDILQPETREVVSSENDLVSGVRTSNFLIVPKAPGKYAIPALVMHAFDPSDGNYYRVESQPLTLVAAGNAPASAGRDDDAQKTAGEDTDPEPEEAWPPIRNHSELARKVSPLAERAFWPWALSLPPLVWIGVTLLPLLRRRLSNRTRGPGAGPRLARLRLREASAALEAGDSRRFHTDVSAALLKALELQLAETLSGLTHAELQARLRARGLPDALTRELIELFSRCDFARFSPTPVTADEMRELLARAERSLESVTRSSPRPEVAS